MTLETKEGLFALMEQIAAEREAARPIVERLVASGEAIEDIEIPEEWRTAGMVAEVSESAYNLDESQPKLSLALSQIAFAIATNVANRYPEPVGNYIYGRALREVGYAQRYLDAYDAAIRAFQSAEDIFSREGALIHDQAISQYGRAVMLYRAGQYDETVNLVTSVQAVFESFADEVRQMKCQCLEAIVSHERGDLVRAKQKYEALLRRLLLTNDLPTLAATYQNLGVLNLALMQTNEAVIAFSRARSISVALNAPSEISRADWGLAQVFLVCAQPEKALPLLQRIRQDYLSRSMPAAAAEVGLHMVDAFVGMNQLDQAKTLTQQVLKECVDHNFNEKAIMALAYLRDILQTTMDPRPAIRHITSYVKRLRSEPALLFVPLEEKR